MRNYRKSDLAVGQVWEWKEGGPSWSFYISDITEEDVTIQFDNSCHTWPIHALLSIWLNHRKYTTNPKSLNFNNLYNKLNGN